MTQFKNLFDLTGRTAVVTGSGYGLGKMIAKGLTDCGASVVISGRTKQALNDTVAEIRDEGGVAIARSFDSTDRESCQNLIDATCAEFGSIEIMVVNHGMLHVASAEETTQQQWSETIETNLTGCFNCAQAAGVKMIEQGAGGSIVMTSSTGSLVGFENLTAYGASKGGVDQLCRQLALEWGRYNIRVNTINPGYTTHRMGGRLEDPKQRDQASDKQKEIEFMTPMQRAGDAEEFVGPVIFLASDAASFISGVSLPIDGGYCAF